MEPTQCACRSRMASASTTPGCSGAAGGSCAGPPADLQCVQHRARVHSAVCVEPTSCLHVCMRKQQPGVNSYAVHHEACAEYAPYSHSLVCLLSAGVGLAHQLQGVLCCVVLATRQHISTCTCTNGSSMRTAAGRRCQGLTLWRVGRGWCWSAHIGVLRHPVTECLCALQVTSCAYPASADTATAPTLAAQQ